MASRFRFLKIVDIIPNKYSAVRMKDLLKFTVEIACQKSFSVDFLYFSHMGFNHVWIWHWCCERQAECKLYVAWNAPVIIPRLRMGIRWKLLWLGTSFSQVDLQIGRNERENNAISETWPTVLNVRCVTLYLDLCSLSTSQCLLSYDSGRDACGLHSVIPFVLIVHIIYSMRL